MSSSENDRRIDYLEFAVEDVAQTRNFYARAFNWTFKDYGPDYCEFRDGRLTGGFAKGTVAASGGGPLVIIYADDLEAMQTHIEQIGGKIVKAIFSFPGGRRFHFLDLNGYELAVWSDR